MVLHHGRVPEGGDVREHKRKEVLGPRNNQESNYYVKNCAFVSKRDW